MIRIWPFNSNRSTVYSVHEPAENEGSSLERAERLAFIADGFSWLTLVFGPAYLAFKRQWIALVIYLVALVAIVNLMNLAEAPNQWSSWALLVLNVLFAFEMSDIQRRSLARAGWRELGAVSGTTAEEAERRFFAAWLSPAPSSPGSGPEFPAASPGPAAAMAYPAATPQHDSVSRAQTLLHKLSSRLITRKSATGT